MRRKSQKREKHTKKSCYSVWPARALRINLAGVTVPDLNWRDIEDRYFPEWFISWPWKGLRPPLQLYPAANTLCFCFWKKQKKKKVIHKRTNLYYDFMIMIQFEFCRAVKDFRVAFFFPIWIQIWFSGWMNGFYEKSLCQQGKIVYKPVLECLPKIKYFSGTASME